LVVGLAATLAAQQPPPLDNMLGRARPRLSAAADTNDWETYFDYAVDQLRRSPDRARLAFYWAARLDPRRAEPLYGRWVAYWIGRSAWWKVYLDEDPKFLESPTIVAVDSLYTRALFRNPLVPQTLDVLLYDQLPGQWSYDPVTSALLSYSAGRFPEAASQLGSVLKKHPWQHPWLHYHRALAFTGMQQWDSALVEVNLLLSYLRTTDTANLSTTYESREMVYYMVGLLHAARGDVASGRQALEQALVENLSFFPAHLVLALMATDRGDSPAAVRELSQALELSRGEPWVRFEYGRALSRAGDPGAAVGQLDSVVQDEPFFADAYLELAVAEENAGSPQAALVAYQRFLQSAPRREVGEIEQAHARVAVLSGPK